MRSQPFRRFLDGNPFSAERIALQLVVIVGAILHAMKVGINNHTRLQRD